VANGKASGEREDWGIFVSRHDATITATAEHACNRQASDCLGDKLAHRALRERSRPTPALSIQARDRLYARMFPSEICMGEKGNDEPDLLS
jgi:hypothetical protein